MYLEENLKLRPEDLSDKAVALDELEEMHQQVCYSNLLSFIYIIIIWVDFICLYKFNSVKKISSLLLKQ